MAPDGSLAGSNVITSTRTLSSDGNSYNAVITTQDFAFTAGNPFFVTEVLAKTNQALGTVETTRVARTTFGQSLAVALAPFEDQIRSLARLQR